MIEIGKDINKSIFHLKNNEIVALPTETVYGMGANALNKKSIVKIYKIKKRPFYDPLICHTNSINKIKKYVSKIPLKAKILGETFWPGPLTILFDKNKNIPDIVTSNLKRVAFRIPNNKLTLKVLEKLDFPIAAPSANPFGYISPTSPEHIMKKFETDIAYILDDGDCNIGIESTIIGFENNKTIIYRVGGISIERIEKVIGKVQVFEKNIIFPNSPGMLKNHYSPEKKMIIGEIELLIKKYKNKKIGILSFNKYFDGVSKNNQIILSKKKCLIEASRNFYKSLHILDNMNIDVILSSLIPNKGIGKNINDRLIKASEKYEI